MPRKDNYYKLKFYELLDRIRKKYPQLKIKLVHKARLPNDMSGNYCDGRIVMAINNRGVLGTIDWQYNVFILAHEFSHFLRDSRKTRKQQKKIDSVYTNFYKNNLTQKERERLACKMAREEYLTDIEAFRVLTKFGLKFSKSDYWEGAHRYSIGIRLSPTMHSYAIYAGHHLVKSCQLPLREIARPLSSKEKDILTFQGLHGDIQLTADTWRDKDA